MLEDAFQIRRGSYWAKCNPTGTISEPLVVRSKFLKSDKTDQLFDHLETAIQAHIRRGFAEFVRDGSLYEKYHFEATPTGFYQIRPHVLTLYCPVCKRENPFRIPTSKQFKKAPDANIGNRPSGGPAAKTFLHEPQVLDSRVYVVGLTCTGCQQFEFCCWIEVDGEQGWARKVGQVPEPSIKVPPELENVLGQDVKLYQRAKICLNQSYGIAACAYLRRLLEDQVNPLLRLLFEVRTNENALQDELDELEEALTRTAFDEKATVLYGRMPDSMKFGGDNPIKLLHKRLSEGVHSMSEEGGVALAAEGLRLFEYLVCELSREHERMKVRQRLNEDVRKLRAMDEPN
jgi:hypothetical protein